MAGNQTNISERSLVDLPSTAKQDWPAVGVAILLLLVFGALIPFAGTPLSNLNAFFPSLDAIVFVTSLITSVLLFARFSILHSRSLLALAGGYLFAALIAIPHALTFAGAFSPTGLLGAGIQTGSWLYIFGHFGFVVAVLAYGVFREEGSKASNARTLPAISLTIAVQHSLKPRERRFLLFKAAVYHFRPLTIHKMLPLNMSRRRRNILGVLRVRRFWRAQGYLQSGFVVVRKRGHQDFAA